jgi:hypothetical protein
MLFRILNPCFAENALHSHYENLSVSLFKEVTSVFFWAYCTTQKYNFCRVRVYFYVKFWVLRLIYGVLLLRQILWMIMVHLLFHLILLFYFSSHFYLMSQRQYLKLHK